MNDFIKNKLNFIATNCLKICLIKYICKQLYNVVENIRKIRYDKYILIGRNKK